MFVPVSCTACGKPFQVPEAALGKPAACPWCSATVTALPVAATVDAPAAPKPVIPVAKAEPRPLSLDDAPARAKRRPRPRPDESPRAKSRFFHPVVIVAVLLISFGAMAMTIAARGYGSGRVPERGWSEFTPPDGSCSVQLPDWPSEEAVAPNPSGSVTGGKRFTAAGWYTRSSAWLAWNDLEAPFAATAAKDKDKVFTASALQSELNREKARLEGTVTKEVEIRFNTAWGIEVHMDTPRGKVIGWLLVAPEGARPRLYVYGVQAKNIAHDSAVVRRMFTSFKVLE